MNTADVQHTFMSWEDKSKRFYHYILTHGVWRSRTWRRQDSNDFSDSKKDALYTPSYCSLQSKVCTKHCTITVIIILINLMTDLHPTDLQSQLYLLYLESKSSTILTSDSKFFLEISQMIHKLVQHVAALFCLEHSTFWCSCLVQYFTAVITTGCELC